jgi:hypothetical protein
MGKNFTKVITQTLTKRKIYAKLNLGITKLFVYLAKNKNFNINSYKKIII